MKGLRWLAGFLSVLPLMGFSSEDPDYPDLASVTIRAPGVELHRLLCPTCGDVRSIIYVPQRNSFFLSTSLGDVWQINAEGHLVDLLRWEEAKSLLDAEHTFRLPEVLRSTDFSLTDSDSPLFLKGFFREGRRRRPLLDFNSHGWRGVYGQGRFELRHRGTILRFSSYHGRYSMGGERRRVELYRLEGSGDEVAEQLAFLVVRSTPYERNAEQLGVYLARPHPAADPPVQSERYRQLNQRLELSLKFEGFERHPGKLVRLVYVNGTSENFDSLPLNNTYPESGRRPPRSFFFSHQLPRGEDERYDYLKFNDAFYEIGERPDRFSASVTMDEEEVLSALTRLQAMSSVEGPVTLLFNVEAMDRGLVYRLSLQKNSAEIPLEQARLSTREIKGAVAAGDRRLYDQDRIRKAYAAAVSGAAPDTDFMSAAEDVAARSNLTPFDVSSAVVKLIIARLEAQDGERAEALYSHYINRIYPELGAHNKAMDIASMAIVIELVHNKPGVGQSAIDTLLGGSGMNMVELQNEILLYNLACYYAVQEDKPKLLEAAALAVSMGKKAEEFLGDSDFANYKSDSDFLQVIGMGDAAH